MVGRAASPRPAIDLPAGAHDRARAAFTRQAETASLREALDGALEAALSNPAPADVVRSPDASELARALQQVSITIEDADALADHLIALGYRNE